jgi:hypothetical protein
MALNIDRIHLENMYLKEHLTMQEIAGIFGVSRQRIYQLIKAAGIDTSKAERWDITCDNPGCGKVFSITRARFKATPTHYCSQACYHGHKDTLSPARFDTKQGRRAARAIMESHLGRPLSDKEIVHHIDGDESNNTLPNLMVFIPHFV